MKKVIVIGLDGFEPKIAEAMMAAGDLPHLAGLRTQGGYARIGTTYPAQTPVAWSTFATGTNPGGHGIFDFLNRDTQTYLPVLSLNRYEQKNAFAPPEVVNMRRGTAVWDHLSRAGIPSTVVRMPCAYPPGNLRGRMLAGVGVPDLRGGLGTSTFYTSRTDVIGEHSEKVVPVTRSGDTIQTYLIGPHNPRKREDFQLKLTIRLHETVPGTGKVTIHSDGQPGTLEVAVGQWSGWLKVKFKVGLLQTVAGMVRFYLARLGPDFALYASPINFDPEKPMFPISVPPEYAQELQTELGPYHTLGMAEDHDGLNNGRFAEDAYLQQCADVLRERAYMMRYELDRFREGFFFCLFDTPDRLQHMLWRFTEPDHPANRHTSAAELSHYRQAIADHYRQCDDIIGQARAYADADTLFITLSDHGMNSFRRGLHLNTWLYEHGFLALKPGLRPGAEAGDLLRSVDWNRTKAYSLGLGCIYLNLNGREANGIVKSDAADSVKTAVVSQLTGLCDPVNGQEVVRSVLTREQLYHGKYAAESPDLLVNFAAGYRVSWETPLGGVPEGLFADNPKKWAGDHVIDPALAPGVLFMNRPFSADGVSLVDMAPTILAALGVPKGKLMEGENRLQ